MTASSAASLGPEALPIHSLIDFQGLTVNGLDFGHATPESQSRWQLDHGL